MTQIHLEASSTKAMDCDAQLAVAFARELSGG